MVVEKKITVGDILTVAALLFTIFSALWSWRQDRQVHRAEQANKIRAAATNTILKLDRWQQVSLSFFDQALVDYDDIKQQLYLSYHFQANRNGLWKALLETEASVRKSHLEDHVELGYVDLYSYNSDVRERIEKVLSAADSAERATFENARGASEQTLCKLFDKNECGFSKGPGTPHARYDPAALYKQFEADNKQQVENHKTTLKGVFEPINTSLRSLLTKSDDELLKDSQIAIP